MNSKTYQEEINKELERFIQLLQVTLPRYTELVKKNNISSDELNELGELEYFLIELNGKISELKKQLEHDLFGLSLDLYYKLKQRAIDGDMKAARKIVIMRNAFSKSLKGNSFINWN
ncbi:MAG: hypothetical protein V4622_03935 [Bacteroidota bacterium]